VVLHWSRLATGRVMSSCLRAASNQTCGMAGFGFDAHASRANSTWRERGRMMSFHAPMRFMIAGTPLCGLGFAPRTLHPHPRRLVRRTGGESPPSVTGLLWATTAAGRSPDCPCPPDSVRDAASDRHGELTPGRRSPLGTQVVLG